jgi:hypothetical protein
MPKITIPHTIESHTASARVNPGDPTRPQLIFWEGENDVQYVEMSLSELEKLDREIGQVLQALS